MPVLMGPPLVRSVVRDAPNLHLAGVWDVEAVVVGGRTFVHAAGFNSSGLSMFELQPGGLLSPLGGLGDDPLRELGGAWMLGSAVVGGVTYLYASGGTDDGISVFRVGGDGRLTPLQDIADTAELALLTPAEIVSVTVGGNVFVAVAATGDSGLSLFRVGPDGQLTPSATLFDSGETRLAGAWGLAAAELGGRGFLFVSGLQDDGISVLEVQADGRLDHRGSLGDAGDPLWHLTGCFGLATTTVAGQTFLIATSFVEDGISVFRVGPEGDLINTSNLSDTAARGLDGVHGVETFVIEGERFVATFAQNDSAVGLFHLGADGILSDVGALFDTSALALGASLHGAFARLGDVPTMVVGGFADGALTVLELGGGADVLTGSSGDDVLLGLGGNDQLSGREGADRMLGGRGDDIYSVDSPGDRVIEAPGSGIDTVRSRISLALPSEIEDLFLQPGAVAALGNSGNNRIFGSPDDNRIFGENGVDRLVGGRGADLLRGGWGADLLEGGAGADVLEGGGSPDRLQGGAGRDTLRGGGSADRFEFLAPAESGPTAALRDAIWDFVPGEDDLVLSAIDADPGVLGNQAFRLDGGDAFETGEIRQIAGSSGWLLLLNLDADEAAEMSIRLAGLTRALAASDFEL